MKAQPLFQNLIFWVTLLAAMPLWLACASYFFLAGAIPILDALGILVPWLVGVNLFLLLVVVVLRNRRGMVVSLATLVGTSLSFGTIREFRAQPQVQTAGLHLLSFNLRHFSDGRYVGNNDPENRITRFILDEDPEIVCFQEFSRSKKKQFRQYPHQFLTPYTSGKTTQAIFSKFPIVGRGAVNFPGTGNNTLYADILLGPDTVRVYNVHLQSYNIESRGFLMQNFGLDFIRRLSDIAGKHLEQARLVRDHRLSAPYPSIICGDFNATAFSHTYRILKQGMKDSFREKGNGWGTSFFLSGTYPFRIDFILSDPQFEVLQHRNYPTRLSDHLPVSAWLEAPGEHPAIHGVGKDVDHQGQAE